MSLDNLTTSGWIWFALTLVIDVTFLSQLAMALRWRDAEIRIWPIFPALMTVWLLWLVMP